MVALKDVVGYFAGKAPDRVAVIFGDERITYGQLDGHIADVARVLADVGVDSGDTVALVMDNCPEFVVGFFSVLRLDAVVFLINVKEPRETVKEYLVSSKAKAVIYSKAGQFDPKNVDGTYVRASVNMVAGKCEVSHTTNPITWRSKPNVEGNLYRMYSSGSTGRPKHLMVTECMVHAPMEFYRLTFEFSKEDIMLGLGPFYHGGIMRNLILPLYFGFTLAIVEKPFPQVIIGVVKRYGVTMMSSVPFIYDTLADAYDKEAGGLGSLRYCFCAGAPLPKEVAEKFKAKTGLNIFDLYAATETGMVSINFDKTEDDSIGRAFPGVKVKVFHEDMTECRPGEIGRIGVMSSAAASGYIDNPELSAKAFAGGYAFPGDLGYLAVDGRIHLAGRDDIINVSGLKVDVTEVRETLLANPGVKEAVVYGIEEEGIMRVKAAVVAAGVSAEQLQDYCRGRLAEYKIPKTIVVLERIPRTDAGKIDKRAIERGV